MMMDSELPPCLSSSNFAIRLISMKKADPVNPPVWTPVSSSSRINLFWLNKYTTLSEATSQSLRQLERLIKTELKDKVTLVKCQKPQSIKMHLSDSSPSLETTGSAKNNPCIVLFTHSYDPTVLKYFQKPQTVQPVYFIIYTPSDNITPIDMSEHFRSSKVNFITHKEKVLLEYLKLFVQSIQKHQVSKDQLELAKRRKIMEDVKRCMESMAGQNKDCRRGKTLDKTTRGSRECQSDGWYDSSPSKQMSPIKAAFLEENCSYPGPGSYNIH